MTGGTDHDSTLTGSGATPLGEGDPRRIGSFRLLGLLGAGGMGRVYLGASQGEPGRPGAYAAVKQVLPALAEDQDFLRHFGHELDNLARLPKAAGARLLASDRTARPPWFATGYIPGITLSEAVRLHGGPLPGPALWRLLREAAAGLRVVHAAGMVHRDLKPSNVMLTAEGVSLIDFGVARAADQSRLTKTGMVVGTPAYMAPEQAVARRELNGAADVFALGSLILYAANGLPPFGDGSGLELLYRIVHEEPDLGALPDTDPQLAAIVTSCLAKDPEDRPTADRLVALAEEHAAPGAGQGAARGAAPGADPATLRLGGGASSPWPAAVAARVAERAAFAAVPPPVVTEEPDPAPGPAPAVVPAAAGPRPPAAEEPVARTPAEPPARKRPRLLVFAIPVVIGAGTTLSVALLPYVTDLNASPGVTKPSATASVTASARPPGVRGPSGSPAPSAAGSASPRPGGSSPAAGGPAGDRDAAGGGAKETGGDADGSGGAGDSGGSGGERPPAGKPPAQSAPSGTHLMRNASNGHCLSEEEGVGGSTAVWSRVCGTPATNGATWTYQWTYQPVSAGTFRVVSKATGKCLESKSYAGMDSEPCNGSDAQLWRVPATASGGRLLENVAEKRCLYMSDGYAVGSKVCDAGDATQQWRDS
ncbi:protein kinase domain-containing protein [Streptomyces tritici]|uniref:serine/threonine-protein kinase n=1 Tax=Streptomyces tritici TaxID=2054410 RepID=UPI003AF08290